MLSINMASMVDKIMKVINAAICPDKSRAKESSAGSAAIYISAKSSEIIKNILIILCVFFFIIQYSLNRRYYIIFLF